VNTFKNKSALSLQNIILRADQLKKNSIFTELIYILVAGMGNVKQGNLQGIMIYFSMIILLGIVLIFAERKFLEQFYNPSQTLCTFSILVYIAFVFFWNGTKLFGIEEKNGFFENDKGIPAEKEPGE